MILNIDSRKSLKSKEALMQFEACDIGFDSVLINDLNLSVDKGDFISVVGPTGIGKSTMIRLIGRVDRDARRPRVLRGLWEKKGGLRTGIVFQSLEQLLPWKTAIENVMLPSLSSKTTSRDLVNKREVRERAEMLLEMVGLCEHKNKYPMDLSGGMRQRVAIARAMLLNPELLLMDEPFGSLDAITRASLQKMLLELHITLNQTVIFVTHDIGEAVKLSGKILVIGKSGRCEVLRKSNYPGEDGLEADILRRIQE